MCGIFAYIGPRKDAAKLTFSGLKSLEYRGYDSWGVAVVSEGKILVKKKTGKIGINNVDDLLTGNLAIGHTRWATHGGVTDANAHPHLDCSGNIAVIHNGIFENYEVIKKELIKKGHKFVSGTDSEVISHLIEDNFKKYSFAESVRATFNKMEGLNAIIAVNNMDGQIIAARNGSPLVVGFGRRLPAGRQEYFLASDASALLPHTPRVYFLEDDQMAVLADSGVKILNVKSGKEVKFTIQKLNWKVSAGEKGKYKHFMLKEIYEQPQILADIAASGSAQSEKMAGVIKKSRGAYLVGCGTASYAALAGTYMFSKIAGRHINYAIGSEFGYHLDFLNEAPRPNGRDIFSQASSGAESLRSENSSLIRGLTPRAFAKGDKDSLVIAISQSGETMDILESVKKAKERGSSIAALTNVLGSSLYRLSDYKTLIGAGPEKAVASTKAFTGMLAHLLVLAYSVKGKENEGKKVLIEAAKAAKKVLSEKNIKNIKSLAKKLSGKNHIYVIGRGLSYPASLETALKIKEISYIHAEGLAAGELKHGPLALVEKGTPCIAFLPDDETYGANLAGAMEMKARGGFVIGISNKNHEVFDYFIPVDDAAEGTIIPNVIVAQLLAYYLTLTRKLDPDMPRNLAKSVTVK